LCLLRFRLGGLVHDLEILILEVERVVGADGDTVHQAGVGLVGVGDVVGRRGVDGGGDGLGDEIDEVLVRSLNTFEYPSIFDPFKDVIEAISARGRYEDETVKIEVLFGDARKLLPTLDKPFDIVYQDAFSPEHNPALWTMEYFAELARLTHQKSVVTTYSTALRTRLALYENGFNVYLNKGEDFRNATVGCKSELEGFEKVDMAHKIACNPGIGSMKDNEMAI